MTRVILVRHGQTDWNKQEIFRGRVDVPLNSQGREEAAAIARSLRDVKLDAFFASPLARATETAEIVATNHALPVETSEGLIDINYGKWQGLQHEEVKRTYAELYKDWKEQPHSVRFPEGETLEEVRERSMGALRAIFDQHPDATVVAVSHRVVNKVLLCAVLGLDNSYFWEIKQDTCTLNILEHSEGRTAVRVLNDTCHLKTWQQKFQTVDF